jgi:hypothetical protein
VLHVIRVPDGKTGEGHLRSIHWPFVISRCVRASTIFIECARTILTVIDVLGIMVSVPVEGWHATDIGKRHPRVSRVLRSLVIASDEFRLVMSVFVERWHAAESGIILDIVVLAALAVSVVLGHFATREGR